MIRLIIRQGHRAHRRAGPIGGRCSQRSL
jgi:hypothetical protein